MPAQLPLVIAYGTQAIERFRPMMDGEVTIEGCSLRFVPLEPGEMLVRSFEDPEFNVAELSLSNYVSRRLAGDSPYIAMPVHISRSFRHGDIYVRADRGILTPQDLRGRRVGITEYQHTAHIWVRGILQEDFGVDPAELHWVSGRLDVNRHPVDAHAVLPPGVVYERIPPHRTLSAMLAEGTLDAIVSPQAPSVFASKPDDIVRLFRDLPAAEDSYFRRTGIFPILHIMGLRNGLVAEHPWLPQRLFAAFVQAKTIALDRSTAAPRLRQLIGPDWYPYGFDPCSRATLAAFSRFHCDQGLSKTPVEISAFFLPA